MEGFTNGSVAIFKEIFDHMKRFRSELFYSELNVTTSHIIFTILATDNIHIVLGKR